MLFLHAFSIKPVLKYKANLAIVKELKLSSTWEKQKDILAEQGALFDEVSLSGTNIFGCLEWGRNFRNRFNSLEIIRIIHKFSELKSRWSEVHGRRSMVIAFA